MATYSLTSAMHTENGWLYASAWNHYTSQDSTNDDGTDLQFLKSVETKKEEN